AMACTVISGTKIVVIQRPKAFASPARRHADPGYMCPPFAKRRGQPVDDRNNLYRSRQAVNIKALHVNDDQRRSGRFEAIKDAHATALLHDPLDNVGRHGDRKLLAHDASVELIGAGANSAGTMLLASQSRVENFD